MRISQNRSAFGGVRCVIARAFKIENGRSRRKAFDGRRCPLSATGENLCCAGRRGRDDARVLSRSDVQIWWQLLLCFFWCRCVSVADQMQFFADAPLSPNMRTQM